MPDSPSIFLIGPTPPKISSKNGNEGHNPEFFLTACLNFNNLKVACSASNFCLIPHPIQWQTTPLLCFPNLGNPYSTGKKRGFRSVNTEQAPSRIPTLDGWRGVAILLVLFDHTMNVFLGDGASPWLQTGQHGVTLFFVLS